jgi:hypothetical protein
MKEGTYQEVIKPTSEQWNAIMDSIKNNQGKPQLVPKELGGYMIDYFINVLPPLHWCQSFVLTSEPYSTDSNGRDTYISFFLKENNYYGVICSKLDFLQMI